MEAWTINGRSYPQAGIAPLKQGQRYRLQFINRSADDHPLHLHRHTFELHTLDAPLKPGKDVVPGRRVRGIQKDVVLATAGMRTAVEFTADNPGDTLMHCHQQNHMDLGFMMVMHYA
jgi:FtsP/CotA-like multicopper oxidase with cupredoxin domain